jgi:hypothetical protein
MDLKDFVSQTLTQIVEGVKESQTVATARGASVNPILSGTQAEAAKHGFLWSEAGFAQVVSFDVALTVTEGTGTKGGIGVFAGALTLGASGQSATTNSSVSHVKFSVPLVLPS